MDGIVHVAGLDTVEVDLQAGKFTVSTKTLRDYAEIEAFILARRPDLYRETLNWFASLPDGIRGGSEIKQIVESALRVSNRARFAVTDEIAEYNNSVAGGGHRFWLAVREHHPEMNIEKCIEVIARSGEEDIAKIEYALDRAGQREILKN